MSAAQTFPNPAQDTPAVGGPSAPAGDRQSLAPPGWEDLRGADDIQFAPVEVPDIPPSEPTWFERAIRALFEFLGMVLEPAAGFIAHFWWLFAALAAAAVLYALLRVYGPLAQRAGDKGARQVPAGAPDWRPDEGESLALLEDADRLAAQGRYDEATRLLLKRSVSQIAAARPDWVEPSTTARELAALPALPDAARAAFRTVAERVERSLFALRSLDRADWEAARAAYAEFALQTIGGRTGAA